MRLQPKNADDNEDAEIKMRIISRADCMKKEPRKTMQMH